MPVFSIIPRYSSFTICIPTSSVFLGEIATAWKPHGMETPRHGNPTECRPCSYRHHGMDTIGHRLFHRTAAIPRVISKNRIRNWAPRLHLRRRLQPGENRSLPGSHRSVFDPDSRTKIRHLWNTLTPWLRPLHGEPDRSIPIWKRAAAMHTDLVSLLRCSSPGSVIRVPPPQFSPRRYRRYASLLSHDLPIEKYIAYRNALMYASIIIGHCI